VAEVAARLHIVIVETTADLPEPTVYTSVFVVALGALCAKTLYVDAIYFSFI
jgi:hypothetical protein